MAFSDDDIARVRAANGIVDVVSEVVSVKRRGRLAWALCPFHKEKTPSFKVDPQTGLYYCFGCREGGDVIRFVEKTKGLTFAEAVEYLAARAGIVITDARAKKRESSGLRRMQEAVGEAADFYHKFLVESPVAAVAREYLDGRGIGSDAIARFRLGFAPDSWDALVRHLRDKGFTEQVMVGAGLAVRTESGRLRDFFRARLLFPVFDAAGRPIAFGGRSVPGTSSEGGPKYRNSPNNSLFNKSQVLYALHLARKEIVSSGWVAVVEGYTDVIALHGIGISNVVATCGTAFGADHVEILRRHGLTTASPFGSLKVVLAFDSDTAGEVAGSRAFDRVLGEGAGEVLDVRIALLPEGKDPADLAAENPDALKRVLQEAVPALGFLIERSLSGARLDSPEARVAAARSAVAQVMRYPDPVVQQQYLQQVAELCGLEPSVVRELWLREKGTAGRQPSPADRRSVTPPRGERPSGSARTVGRPGAEGRSGVPASKIPRGVPPSEVEAVRLYAFGSPEAAAELERLGLSEVVDSGAARRALEAVARARRDVASALRAVDGDEAARSVLAEAVAGKPEFPTEETGRWEASVLDSARRRLLEKEAARAKEAGDLQTYHKLMRDAKQTRNRWRG